MGPFPLPLAIALAFLTLLCVTHAAPRPPPSLSALAVPTPAPASSRPPPLFARQDCPEGQMPCGAQCIANTESCCAIPPNFCKEGYYCMPDGIHCCPNVGLCDAVWPATAPDYAAAASIAEASTRRSFVFTTVTNTDPVSRKTPTFFTEWTTVTATSGALLSAPPTSGAAPASSPALVLVWIPLALCMWA